MDMHAGEGETIEDDGLEKSMHQLDTRPRAKNEFWVQEFKLLSLRV